MGVPGTVFADQCFRAHVVVGGFVIIRRGPCQPGFTHAFTRHQLLAFVFRQFVTDFRAGLLFVEFQFMHRAHAVFVIVDGFRLNRVERTS